MDRLEQTALTIQGFARAFGRTARDGAVIKLAGIVASVAPAIGFRSLFNAAAYRSADDLGPALPRLSEAFDEAGIAAWAVWAHESDHRAAALLTEAGLRLDSSPTAMWAAIEEIEAPPGAIDAERTDDLEAFDAVLAAGYDFPPGVFPYCFPRLLDEFHGYLARGPDGRPACAVATIDCGVDCGVNLVATAPWARGHGLASALMARALADARTRGCTTTTLQATAMGRGLYARLGYHDLGAMNLWEKRTEKSL